MKTIALRFSDSFAPKNGTIIEHDKVIGENGFVWYGKLGKKISHAILSSLLQNGPTKILFIKAGSAENYWATLVDASYEKQAPYPSYYGQDANYMKTWLKIIKFEVADADVLKKCIIPSTGNKLSDIYKKSMGSYFIIEIQKDYFERR